MTNLTIHLCVCVLITSLLSTFTKEQQTILQEFVDKVYSARIINDIYKMLFRRSFFARFLVATNFNSDMAVEAFREYVKWRQVLQIDMLMEHDFLQFEQIKEFMPNGFHEMDREGRPIFFMDIGQLNLKELAQIITPDVLV